MATDPRQGLRDAGVELHAAAVALSETLQVIADRMWQVGEDLSAGSTVVEAMSRADVGQSRKRVAEAIDRFEQARHKLRLASFGAALAEGATTTELAQVWNLPLSLVERFARQARGTGPSQSA